MPRRRRQSADGDANSKSASPRARNGAGNGFEAQLFLAADKLRKNLEPSDYKHVVLADLPEAHLELVRGEACCPPGRGRGGREDPDEYLAENVFWVPKEARDLPGDRR